MASIVDLDGRPASELAVESLLARDASGNLLKAAAQFTILIAGAKGDKSLELREFMRGQKVANDEYADWSVSQLLSKEEMSIFPAVSEGILYLSQAAVLETMKSTTGSDG